MYQNFSRGTLHAFSLPPEKASFASRWSAVWGSSGDKSKGSKFRAMLFAHLVYVGCPVCFCVLHVRVLHFEWHRFSAAHLVLTLRYTVPVGLFLHAAWQLLLATLSQSHNHHYGWHRPPRVEEFGGSERTYYITDSFTLPRGLLVRLA
jgi:hypothetical protein